MGGSRPGHGRNPQLKIYPLTQPLKAEDLATIKRLVPAADVSSSVDNRQLSVVAVEVDQLAVETLLKQLTEAAQSLPQPQLKVYPLQHPLVAADVTQMASLVPGAQITLGEDGRQLRVLATAEEHSQLEQLVTQFEQAAAAEIKPQLTVIPLAKTLQPTVLATLQTLVPAAQLTVSPNQKELIVVARDDELATIRKTLDQISVSAETQDLQLEIYQAEGLSAA